MGGYDADAYQEADLAASGPHRRHTAHSRSATSVLLRCETTVTATYSPRLAGGMPAPRQPGGYMNHARLNVSFKHASASSPRARSTTTLMRTSLVLIMLMLMPRSASAPNIRRAPPVCVRIP